MSLSDRLQALLHLYARALDLDSCEDEAARLEERFRREVRLLVSEYGPSLVEAALDDIPDNPSPPMAPH
jgi:hypothetical protein